MQTDDVEVPARYYLRLAGLLEPLGIDFAELAASAGLQLDTVTGVDSVISFSLVDRLINAVFERTGKKDLGFELGKLLSASSHTFVGFAMLNSATLDEALHFEARYFRLIMPSFAMRYRSHSDSGEVHIAPLVPMSDLCLHFHLEAIAMAALREIDDLTEGRSPTAALDFSIAEPEHAELYAQLPGVTASFGVTDAPGLHIRLLQSPRDYCLPVADPVSLQLAEERCQALLQRTTRERNLSGWVAMTLREVSEGLPSLEELAGLLNVSKRTLNRYLRREGTSYRTLAKQIQHELACKRLTEGGMSISQVAYSLGFSEVANFTRAFRRNAGCTPGEYAKHNSAKPGHEHAG